MPYRLLGNSGLRVSEAALGTMTFGDDWGWGAAKDEARKVYDAFREAGGNFIDTANVYTNGTSESFLGEFMQGHRQSLVLATKYTNAAPGTDPNAAGKHRKSMMQAEGLRKPSKNRYFSRMNLWCSIPPDTLVGLMKANRRATLGRFGCSLHNDLEATPWVVQWRLEKAAGEDILLQVQEQGRLLNSLGAPEKAKQNVLGVTRDE